MIQEQIQLMAHMRKVISIFNTSEGAIRPHFVLTGPSGSGKSHLIQTLAAESDLGYFEVNAAQLTKEGTSGNSLAKALSPLFGFQHRPTICFVDEFDKLFISGNHNSQGAHETSHGVQNEFLKVLESETTAVFHDYGKYLEVPCSQVLFVFAGAFNNEEDIDLDRLRELGIKTEFLGRVGLVMNTQPISLESMLLILEDSSLLNQYLQLFPDVERKSVITALADHIRTNYQKNALGIRMINTLLHQYFIQGGKLSVKQAKQSTFQKTLKLG